MTIVLSLAAAVSWGCSDFVGGLTSRALKPLVVVLWINVLGLIGCAALSVASGAGLGDEGLAWSIGAGVLSGVGFVVFYAALAAGPISLVAPITASGAAIPAVVGIAGGESLSTQLGLGLLAALIGGILTSRPPSEPGEHSLHLPARSLGLALASAVAIGGILTFLQQATDAPGSDPVAVIAVQRGFGLLVCVLIVAALRTSPAVPGELWRGVLFVAVADTAANLLFAAASDGGTHTIAAILASLYPVSTVLLAAIILRERLSGTQGSGVLLAITGVALVSAA